MWAKFTPSTTYSTSRSTHVPRDVPKRVYIGFLYGEMEQHEKALEYQKRGLQIRERILGPEHPETAASYNNVSISLNAVGQLDTALEHMHRALEIAHSTLGETHPQTEEINCNFMSLLESKSTNNKHVPLIRTRNVSTGKKNARKKAKAKRKRKDQRKSRKRR